jgi:hypothetical protein
MAGGFDPAHVLYYLSDGNAPEARTGLTKISLLILRSTRMSGT